MTLNIPDQYRQPKEVFVTAGENAFKLRVPFYNNPYKSNPQHSLWIRGYKRQEREFFEAVARSKRFVETLELEEVTE